MTIVLLWRSLFDVVNMFLMLPGPQTRHTVDDDFFSCPGKVLLDLIGMVLVRSLLLQKICAVSNAR